MNKKINLFISLLLVIMGICGILVAQVPSQNTNTPPKVIQFSGVISSADTLSEPISFVNISIKNSRRGTVSDVNGYFSLPIYQTDTIIFAALGYGKFEFVLKDTVPNNRLFFNIKLKSQAYSLQGITIYGLTKDNFKQAFLNLELPEATYNQKVNPKIIPTPEEIGSVPPIGLVFSPSELLKNIPAIKEASDKKKHKQQIENVERSGQEIPIMK
jgi:hypothetical protein